TRRVTAFLSVGRVSSSSDRSPDPPSFPTRRSSDLGAVHGLHSAAGEPLAAGIKKQARGFRIVDAFKESHPTGGLIGEPCLLFVDEGGHPTDGFVLPVFQ